MAGTDADGVKGLLTGGQLARQDIWLNKIQTGGNWNYAPLAQTGQGLTPSFPHVLTAGGSGEVRGQTDIPLPGQGGAMTLLINRAEYDSNAKKYYLNATISHPGRNSNEIIALLSSPGGQGKTLPQNIELDGMQFESSDVQTGDADYSIDPGADTGTTVFTITTGTFTKALDKYRLTVTIGGDSLSAQVDYGNPNYWPIPDLAKWNEYVSLHGKTSENFLITGNVDFSGANNGVTQYNGLKIGRLESGENAGAATGFKGLRYDGGPAGTPWIETILQPVKGLSFDDMQFNFNSTTQERGVTGAIITAPNILDCELSKVYIMVNSNSAEKSGFISNITDTAEDVTLNDVRLTSSTVSNGSRYYAGALCAILGRGFNNIKAEKVTVDMPGLYYVGGIIGSMNNFGAPMTQTADLDDVTVKGFHIVGGFCGTAVYKSIVGMEAKNLNVEAMYSVSGLMPYVTGNSENITVRDSTVKSTLNDSWTTGRYEAGGVMMYSSGWGNQIKHVLVDNVKVSGGFLVGAYCGSLGSTNVYDLEVVNCTVTGNKLTERSGWPLSDLAEKYGNIAAGGVAGIALYGDKTNYGLRGVTVRNTAVTGMFNVGGLYGSGFTEGGLHASQAFIAEDVTVTATRSYTGGNGRQLSNAGGAVGRAFAYSLTDIACGATVSAPGEAVGGLIGLVETGGSTALAQSLTTSYFAGKATGSDRVGGILGLYNSASAGPTAANISNVLVAANVYGTGNPVSLWFNNNASTGCAGDAKVYIWD
jgi:hypothetical protein